MTRRLIAAALAGTAGEAMSFCPPPATGFGGKGAPRFRRSDG